MNFLKIRRQQLHNSTAILSWLIWWKIPGCDEASEGDAEEWMDQDDAGEPFGDDEIVAAVKAWEKIEEDDIQNSQQQEKMSHTEGVKAVKGALRYFEQQGASAMDIIFLHWLHDEATRRRTESEKQSKITSFFQTPLIL